MCNSQGFIRTMDPSGKQKVINTFLGEKKPKSHVRITLLTPSIVHAIDLRPVPATSIFEKVKIEFVGKSQSGNFGARKA